MSFIDNNEIKGCLFDIGRFCFSQMIREQMTIAFSWLNGFRFCLDDLIERLCSKIIDGKKTSLEALNSNCFLRLEGTIRRIRRFLSAHLVRENQSQLQLVFPRPTSSAKIAPFDNGDLKAKSAA